MGDERTTFVYIGAHTPAPDAPLDYGVAKDLFAAGAFGHAVVLERAVLGPAAEITSAEFPYEVAAMRTVSAPAVALESSHSFSV